MQKLTQHKYQLLERAGFTGHFWYVHDLVIIVSDWEKSTIDKCGIYTKLNCRAENDNIGHKNSLSLSFLHKYTHCICVREMVFICVGVMDKNRKKTCTQRIM